MTNARLDLTAIETSLRELNSFSGVANTDAASFLGDTLLNMVHGYRLVDHYVCERIDLFALGNSRFILELNHTVLFGPEITERARRYEKPISRSEHHFYNQPGGGIGSLIDFYNSQEEIAPYSLAAALYIFILARPQLFLEGNHRTGALLVSYILLRNSLPPFVLTTRNFSGLFESSSEIGKKYKSGIAMLMGYPRLRKQISEQLRDSSDIRFLSNPVGNHLTKSHNEQPK